MTPSTLPVVAESSLFVGVFRSHAPSQELQVELKRIGVDVERLEAKYRVDIWARTLDLVRQAFYANLSSDESWRRLGYEFGRGFAETIGGRLVLSLLPFMTPAKLLARMPRFFKLGRPDIEASWVDTSKGGTLTLRDQALVSPYFNIGMIDYVLQRMSATATTRVEQHSLDRFSIHYEWA